ncbi:MAG: glycosyltransferase [Dehalococcoidia bacterium]|nr:MAG: glycosyltransferase [Dehalococcoidia bacterium]
MNILIIHEVDYLTKVVFDIHLLAEGLSLRGHRVWVIDYENTWRRGSLADLGRLKTREVNAEPRAFPKAAVSMRRPGFIKIPGLSRLSAAATHYQEIKRTIKEKNIQAIVLYSVPTNGLAAISLACKNNIPVVFRSIDILNRLVPYPALRPMTRFLEKKVYAGADMILTLTPKLSEYVNSLGADPERVKLLPMPVDTDLFHPSTDTGGLRQRWGLGQKAPVIVFIGTLFDFSGLDALINQFPQLLKEIPEAKLLIVGDGPQRPGLEKIIAELCLAKQVIITGFQPYATMPQYINLAALCINSFLITDATRDIFPGKIVQYLACGKAVVATPLPGMMAVTAGEEQGVIYAGDAGEMVKEVISLLKSPQRQRKLGQAGLSYVTGVHQRDKIVYQLEARLEEAVKEKQSERVSK